MHVCVLSFPEELTCFQCFEPHSLSRTSVAKAVASRHLTSVGCELLQCGREGVGGLSGGDLDHHVRNVKGALPRHDAIG